MATLLRQNLFTNPNSEAGIFSSGGAGTGTKTQDSTQKHSGSFSTKYVRSACWVGGYCVYNSRLCTDGTGL